MFTAGNPPPAVTHSSPHPQILISNSKPLDSKAVPMYFRAGVLQGRLATINYILTQQMQHVVEILANLSSLEGRF